MIVRRIVRVEGRVQGVYFRASARAEAARLAVAGEARNEADGSVTLDLEGDQAAVAALVEWCRRGPPRARVDRLCVAEAPPSGRRGFRVA